MVLIVLMACRLSACFMSAFRLLLILTGLAIYFVFRQFGHARVPSVDTGAGAVLGSLRPEALAVR